MGFLKQAIQQAAAEMGREYEYFNTCAPHRIESSAQAKYHDTLRNEAGYTRGIHRAKGVAKAPAPTATQLRQKDYQAMKRKHPDALLLFRVGDFYELYNEDAEHASQTLGITLTKRSGYRHQGFIPLAGFPHHALDTYLPRLVRAGYRVAICETVN